MANPLLMKAAVMAAADKRTWNLIGAILAGFLCLCLLPAFVLLAISGGSDEIPSADSAMIDSISDKYGVIFTEEERENILVLIEQLTKKQPPDH